MHLSWPRDSGQELILDDTGLSDLYAPPRTHPWLRINFVTSLDGAVEVGVRVRDLLGKRRRVPGLDEHVETPGFDLLAF